MPALKEKLVTREHILLPLGTSIANVCFWSCWSAKI